VCKGFSVLQILLEAMDSIKKFFKTLSIDMYLPIGERNQHLDGLWADVPVIKMFQASLDTRGKDLQAHSCIRIYEFSQVLHFQNFCILITIAEARLCWILQQINYSLRTPYLLQLLLFCHDKQLRKLAIIFFINNN